MGANRKNRKKSRPTIPSDDFSIEAIGGAESEGSFGRGDGPRSSCQPRILKKINLEV